MITYGFCGQVNSQVVQVKRNFICTKIVHISKHYKRVLEYFFFCERTFIEHVRIACRQTANAVLINVSGLYKLTSLSIVSFLFKASKAKTRLIAAPRKKGSKR